MFRRHPEACAEWNADFTARCAARQAEILNSAAQMLRPGGRLAYSTCTFNSLENEGSIKRFLAEHPDFHPVPFVLPGLPAAPQGILRHTYLEGPPQHKDPAKFITQVILPIV